MPLLTNFMYGIITGTRVSIDFDIICTFFMILGITGDVVIMLMVDRRWNAAAKDLIAGIKK